MKAILIAIGLLAAAAVMAVPLSLDTFFPKPKPVISANVIFGGDMMFDRYIRQVSDIVSPDYPLSCIRSTLLAADAVVANLEGPLTDSNSLMQSATGERFTFTFPPGTAALLLRHNIAVVNLGNNHILDFGQSGAESTLKYLDAAHVAYFGDPLEHRVATTSVNGVALAFINYNEFFGGAVEGMVSRATLEIETARAAGMIPIVYTHWGEEYMQAGDRQKRLAREFIDAGAEMVIGSHPHVVQEHEVYLGKHIYYSLGNFIFDQYFSPKVRRGLLINVLFSATGVIGVEEIPINLETDGRTCLVLP